MAEPSANDLNAWGLQGQFEYRGDTILPGQIETIDMARRGLHNEGSELLRERLNGKVELDFDTARRLFTLVCVLHWRG